MSKISDAAQAAWVDYKPPVFDYIVRTSGQSNEHDVFQSRLIRHAFLSGYEAAERNRDAQS